MSYVLVQLSLTPAALSIHKNDQPYDMDLNPSIQTRSMAHTPSHHRQILPPCSCNRYWPFKSAIPDRANHTDSLPRIFSRDLHKEEDEEISKGGGRKIEYSQENEMMDYEKKAIKKDSKTVETYPE